MTSDVAAKTSPPSLHQFHQLAKAIHHVVFDVLRSVLPVDLVEELAGSLDLGFLDLVGHHRGHGALCFGHEVNVFDSFFLERNSPVRVVVTDGVGMRKPRGSLAYTTTSVQVSSSSTNFRSMPESVIT